MAKILNLHTNTNYLHRMTILFLIATIGKQINSDYMNKNILPVVVSLSKDPVANVRMNVAKTLKVSG